MHAYYITLKECCENGKARREDSLLLSVPVKGPKSPSLTENIHHSQSVCRRCFTSVPSTHLHIILLFKKKEKKKKLIKIIMYTY